MSQRVIFEIIIRLNKKLTNALLQEIIVERETSSSIQGR